MMRTQEQIEVELNARMRELEKEAARLPVAPKLPKAKCMTCRWTRSKDRDGLHPYVCTQPLVVGFETNRLKMPVVMKYHQTPTQHPLCGVENALWQPKGKIHRMLWKAINYIYLFIFQTNTQASSRDDKSRERHIPTSHRSWRDM